MKLIYNEDIIWGALFSGGWVAFDKSFPTVFPKLLIWFSDTIKGNASQSSSKNTSDLDLFFFPRSSYRFWNFKNIFFFKKNPCPYSFLLPQYTYTRTLFLKGRKLKMKKQKLSSLELSSKPQPDFLGSDSVFSWEQLNRTWIWVWLLAGPPSSPPTGVWVWWKVKRIWNSIQLILIFKNKTQKPVLQNTRSIFTSTCNNILN